MAPLLLTIAACTPRARGSDLLQESVLVEATLESGRDLAWARGQMGKQVRINDVVLRTVPAPTPSRLRFHVDVPEKARLTLACGIPPDHHGGSAVEIVVSVLREGARDDAPQF